jgi:RHS repeat-associated protein
MCTVDFQEKGMYEHNADDKISFVFTDGSNSDWYCGPCWNPVPAANADAWVPVSIQVGGSVSSPGPMAGKTVSALFMGDENDTGTGAYDVMMADIAIQHVDGSVTPFPVVLGSVPYGGDMTGVTNQTSVGEKVGLTSGAVGAASDTAYYTSDHLGSARMEFAGGGWPVWAEDYAPYGQEIAPQTTANNFKFTGYERDQETGLDYASARHYTSAFGRFMSPDPSGLSYADPTNPQSLNLYSYVLNNPLIYNDPTGLDHCTSAAGWAIDVVQDLCDAAGGAWVKVSYSDPTRNDDGSYSMQTSWSVPSSSVSAGVGGASNTQGGATTSLLGTPNSILNTLACSLTSPLRALSAKKDKTFGVGGGGGVGLGVLPPFGLNLSGSVQVVADSSGNVGLAVTWGFGGAFGIGAIVGGQFSGSDASSINQLRGPSKTIGLSAGDGLAGGIDFSEGLHNGPVSANLTVGAGAGARLSGSYGTTDTSIPLSTTCSNTAVRH